MKHMLAALALTAFCFISVAGITVYENKYLKGDGGTPKYQERVVAHCDMSSTVPAWRCH